MQTQCFRATSRVIGLATVIATLAVAGCGSSTSTSASGSAATRAVPRGAWTGLGATLADWESAHPKNPGGCEETPCYGGQVPDGGKSTNQFSGVTTTEAPEYRVDGYTQAIGDGTPLAAAKADVLRLLPSDTRVTAFWVNWTGGDSCAFWNLKSKTLGLWLAKTKKVGDAEGALGIDFFSYDPNDEPVFKPNDVSNAIVSIAATRRGISC